MEDPRDKTPIPDITEVSSTNECTGLMPTPPMDEGELESYQELFSMALPKDVQKKGERS